MKHVNRFIDHMFLFCPKRTKDVIESNDINVLKKRRTNIYYAIEYHKGTQKRKVVKYLYVSPIFCTGKNFFCSEVMPKTSKIRNGKRC